MVFDSNVAEKELNQLDDLTKKQEANDPELNELEEPEIKERRNKLGRYTLDEAATFVANNAEIRANFVLKEMEESAGTGELKTYLPDGIQPYEPKPREGNVFIPGLSNPIKNYVPTWYVEAYWDDLNAWLKEKELRIENLFPDPKIRDAKNVSSQKGITKREVISAFSGMHFNEKQWGSALSTIPDWLKECRVLKGVRGNNKVSALWNPVKIAIVLLAKDIDIKKLDAVFISLKDWTNEWRDASDQFRDYYN